MKKIESRNSPKYGRFVTQPVSQIISRKLTLEDQPSLSRFGNLEMFHDHLLQKQKMLMSNISRAQSTEKKEDIKTFSGKNSLKKDLIRVTQELNQMEKEFNHKKSSLKQERQYGKLNRFIDTLQISLQQKRHEKMRLINPFSQAPPPVYYPVPMPIPMYQNPNLELPHISKSISKNGSEYSRSSFGTKYRNDSFYKRNKKNHPLNKTVKLKKYKRKFKKVVNSILFTIYLRNFCYRMRQQRKAIFNKLQPSFQVNLKSTSEDIKKLLKPFYSLLFSKRQISYDIQQNQNKQIRKGKVETIRKFIGIVLQACKKWMQFASSNKKQVQILYFLLKHGNYSCNIPILTPDQLQLTCISLKFNFISSDSNLQNVAFINFFFIKILIYNILLSPENVSSQFEDEILSNNLYIFSSVLYQLLINVQDEYMIQVPKIYKIGNSYLTNFVKSSIPLVYKKSLKIQGQIISGLKGEEWVDKNFKILNWSNQTNLIKQTIKKFHNTMSKYHKLQMKKFF